MEDMLKELVLQAPWGVAILVVVMAFLRHLGKHSGAICQVAKALARLEERVEAMQEKISWESRK